MDTKPPAKRYRRDETADPTNPNPSIVVHVRNLSPKATEADLLEALSHFGPIAYATCIAAKRMALVEFEDIECARKCVVFAQTTPINVAGYPALFNYSTSQAIQRIGLESETPNSILVLTIYNAHYTINVDVIYQICSPHGQVLRIAMIKRTMVQALVEFESIEAAKKTKHAINGADIYSGCCTLKVEFAKPDHVKVVRNDQDQWDYTSKAEGRKALISDGPPSTGTRAVGPPARAPLANNPASFGTLNYDDYSQPTRAAYGGGPPRGDSFLHERVPSRPVDGFSRFGGAAGKMHIPPSMDTGFLYDTASADYRTAARDSGVIMIYGVNHEQFNCVKIFNLLCGYGNCMKVKFMHKKQDTCMAEMDSSQGVVNAMKYLQNVAVFETTLTLRPSKQNTLHELHEPFEMPDGTPSFVDFSKSRNHRFLTPEAASKNRLAYPSSQLHWFNAPTTMTEERLKKIFIDKDVEPPSSVTIFNTKSERSSTGMAEFSSAEAATAAMIVCNHVPIQEVVGRPPYNLKLAFSDGK